MAQEFSSSDPRQGPVHLQAYIDGVDVRAHAVREDVFAEGIGIVSTGVDYRKRDTTTRHWPCQLPGELNDKIVLGSKQFGRRFMGWDFKVDPRVSIGV